MEKHKDTNAWVGVYEFIRDRIISGGLNPGEKINEREITELVRQSGHLLEHKIKLRQISLISHLFLTT